jgi:hypothetical protein
MMAIEGHVKDLTTPADQASRLVIKWTADLSQPAKTSRQGDKHSNGQLWTG